MTERGAAPSDFESRKDTRTRRPEEVSLEKNSQKLSAVQRLLIAGTVSVGIIGAVACGHETRANKQTETVAALTATSQTIETPIPGLINQDQPTCEVSTSVAYATPTPDQEVIDTDRQVQEELNRFRKIDGKNWWEAISDDRYEYREIVELYDGRTVKPGTYIEDKLYENRGRCLVRIDKQNGELKRSTTDEEVYNSIFNTETRKLAIGKDPKDGTRFLAYELATRTSWISEVEGQDLGVVNDPNSGIISARLVDRSCAEGPDGLHMAEIWSVGLANDGKAFPGKIGSIALDSRYCLKIQDR